MKVNGKADLRVVSEVVEAFEGAIRDVLPTIDPIKCKITTLNGTLRGSPLVDEVTFETDEVPIELVETVFQAFLMGWTLQLKKVNREIEEAKFR